MKLPTLNIGARVTVYALAVCFVAILLLVLWAYLSSVSSLNKAAEAELAQVASGVKAMCDIQSASGSSDQGELRRNIADIKIAKTGYVFVMDGNSDFVIHPESEGKNVKEHEFAQFMLASKQESELEPVIVRYKWEGREKVMAVRYHPEYDWYIGASSWSDEFNAPAMTMKLQLAVVGLLALLAVAATLWWVGRSISKRILTELKVYR